MAGMVILAAALALSSVSYLLFHTCAELFSIVIAETVFLIAWATRDLVLADKLSGDAWAVMLTLAGSVLGVVVATASPTVREIARKALQ